MNNDTKKCPNIPTALTFEKFPISSKTIWGGADLIRKTPNFKLHFLGGKLPQEAHQSQKPRFVNMIFDVLDYGRAGGWGVTVVNVL